MKPILKALLLADHVYEDSATGKKIIAGTLNTVVTSEAEPPVHAYIGLTEIHGSAQFRLRYVDLDDRTTLREFAIDVTGGNPLDIIEVAVPFGLPTPHTGYYALDLLSGEGADAELLGSHRLRAVEGENQ